MVINKVLKVKECCQRGCPTLAKKEQLLELLLDEMIVINGFWRFGDHRHRPPVFLPQSEKHRLLCQQ